MSHSERLKGDHATGILGIHNRTENWKTARFFVPFYTNDAARVALAQKLGESIDTCATDIQIELFWKGMRDYIHGLDKECKPTKHDLRNRHSEIAERYRCLFPTLQSDIEGFIKETNSEKPLQSHNYSPEGHDNEKKLYDNLRNTEIDIVLVTPKNLYIGEAKDESRLDVKYEYVLMHQLIRQYVMAAILLDRIGCDKRIVPFVVGDGEKLRKRYPQQQHIHQINFMICQGKNERSQGWLNEKNILSWDCIEKLTSSAANNG